MSSGDFEVAEGAVRLRVEGLSRTLRALQDAGAASSELSALMRRIGMVVVRAANPPRESGRLAGTVRAGRGKTKAVVKAGGARAPYAGIEHYGSPHIDRQGTPFLTDALRNSRSAVLTELNDGLGDLLKKYKLQ